MDCPVPSSGPDSVVGIPARKAAYLSLACRPGNVPGGVPARRDARTGSR